MLYNIQFGYIYQLISIIQNPNSEFNCKSVAPRFLRSGRQLLPQNFIALVGGLNVTMPWIKFNAFHSHNNSIYYPLFLMAPKYNHDDKFNYDDSNFQNMSYLSNGSGCASGSSFDEAAVHALNEAIERDSTSLFLYAGFIRNKTIKIVNKATIPTHLQEYIKIIEAEFNDELFIVDITSKIGVPCFCAMFSKYDAPILPKGYGASLSKTYALERAILESLQPVHLRNEHLNRVEKNTVTRLRDYPLLQRAAIGDIKQILQQGNFTIVDFHEIPDLYDKQTVIEQKNQILALIQQHGLDAYYYCMYETCGYSLVKVIVSEFSPLYSLQIGKLIMPDIQILDKRL